MMFSTNNNPDYSGPERRQSIVLNDEQIYHIAEIAAEIAINKTVDKITPQVIEAVNQAHYAAVGREAIAIGKTMMEKLLWLIGIGMLTLATYLYNKGIIKLD